MKRILCLVLSIFLLTNIAHPYTAQAAKSDSKDTADSQNTDTKKSSSKKKKKGNSALWPKAPKVEADTAILMDMSTGLVLYEKNSQKKEYPASITKIMTTLLALENCSMGEIVTFSHDSVFGIETGSSHIGIDEGEKLTMEQCLYAIMLASANEVSWGVGEHIAGSISEFAKMMNARAKELGCVNTNFVNANGLHDDDHYTCAYDMALIARAAMNLPMFCKITSTQKYTIPPTNKHKTENAFLNHHQMIYGYKYPQFEYEYCTGGKTGYTSDAGNTLVTFAQKDGIRLVCVVMRASGPSSSLTENEYTDTTSLFDFAFENYTQYELTSDSVISPEDSPLFTTYNPFFNPDTSPLRIGENACVLLPNSAEFEDAEQTVELYDNIELKEGENIIGRVSYTYGGKVVGSTDILFDKKDSTALTFSQKTKKVDDTEVTASNRFNLKPIIIIAIIVVIALFIWLYFFIINRRNKKRSKYDYHF